MKSRFSELSKLFAVFLAVLTILAFGVGVAAAEGEDALKSGYERAQSHYRGAAGEATVLKGYWQVFGAYATLGDTIQKGGYVYDMDGENENHVGARVLALLMMGEDPYHYNGCDYVARVKDSGLRNGFAIPVFNFMALQAAGAEITADEEKAYVDYCISQMTGKGLAQGPDIGGWAVAALYHYMEHPAYRDAIAAAVEEYLDAIGESMVGASMGSATISMGCSVTALTALCAAGREGCNPGADSPWVEQKPLEKMYQALLSSEGTSFESYNHQYYMEFADLYHVLYEDGVPGWSRCRLDGAAMTALIREAKAFLKRTDENSLLLMPGVKRYLAAAEALSAEELASPCPQWGALYFDLKDAMVLKNDPSAFADVGQGWYREYVDKVLAHGVMNGTDPKVKIFEPETTVTRAMVMQILYNMEGHPAYSTRSRDNPFTDVKAKDWYGPAVLWAYQNGIARGTTATTFAADENVTRQQLAAFMYRYLTTCKGETLSAEGAAPFRDDGQIDGSYAKVPVYALVNRGILNGMGDQCFCPLAFAKRSELAKIIAVSFLE